MKVQLLTPEAFVPTRGSAGAAGLDLSAAESVYLYPEQRALVDTGIAIALADNEVGLIWPRSGWAVKYGVDTLAGVVDSDYRGSVKVALINHGEQAINIKPGNRIAQLIVQKCWIAEPEVVDYAENTQRGTGGFGSTGV